MTGNTTSPTLHVLNKAPDHTRSSDCLDQLAQGDTLLLIEDAVLGLASGTWLRKVPEGVTLSVLEPDMVLRGVSAELEAVCRVDYEDFVSLICQHARNIHW